MRRLRSIILGTGASRRISDPARMTPYLHSSMRVRCLIPMYVVVTSFVTLSGIIGKKYTVAQYFEFQAKKIPAYGKLLSKGKLRYPALPTINVGSNSKPILIPAELVSVPGGQSRTGVRDWHCDFMRLYSYA